MVPDGTVRSSGPSLNLGNDFSRPRISMAFTCMQLSLFFDNVTQKLNDLSFTQARFTGLTGGFLEQFPGSGLLHFAAASMSRVRNKGSKTLSTVDDSFAFEFFICALDRDDADQQV